MTTESPVFQRSSLGNFEGEFKSPDYIIFVVSLVISLVIGMIASCKSNNEALVENFLLGGRNMHFFTVGLSMLGSVMNGVFIIGGPSEIYFNGAIYCLIAIAIVLVAPVAAFVFVPMFRKSEATSAYKYLGQRFSTPVQVAASIVFTLYMTIFLGVVLYAPAMAFSEVTGLPLWFSVAITGLFCTKYTVVGGIRAVIWTDTYQITVMIFGLFLLVVLGGVKAGGAAEVLRKVHDGDRFNFGEWSPNPTVRHTVWTQIVGFFFQWLPMYGANQMVIQRYNTVGSNREARRAVWISVLFTVITMILVAALGLVMYAFYSDCDPYLSGRIRRTDQIVPLFLMEVSKSSVGLPGLFTAAVFAAALSSMSSAINSMSAVCLEDFIKPILKRKNRPVKDGAAIKLSKVLAFVFGLLSIALSYIAAYLGPRIIQIPVAIWGIVGGPLLGLFIMGMFFPCCNSWGAMMGLLGSLIFTIWMVVGNILYHEPFEMLPLSTGGCTDHNATSVNITTTLFPETLEVDESRFQNFYNISYAWYGLYGLLACMIIGLLVSLLMEGYRRVTGKHSDMAEDSSKENTPSRKDSMLAYHVMRRKENDSQNDVGERQAGGMTNEGCEVSEL